MRGKVFHIRLILDALACVHGMVERLSRNGIIWQNTRVGFGIMHHDKSGKENQGQSAEAVRRVLRKLIPNPSLYGRGSRIFSQLQTIRLESWRTYQTLYRPPVAPHEERTVRLKRSAYPIHFRPGTQDVNALVQIVSSFCPRAVGAVIRFVSCII